MTTKKFSGALGNVDEKYITEATSYSEERSKRTWVRWVAIAACLSLIVVGGMLGKLFHPADLPSNSVASYFVITAYAAEGELSELELSEGFYNSTASKENAFGVDMPLFEFSVRPSDLKGNEALYSRFDISVSYNGVDVNVMDDHIMVAYLIPMPNSDGEWAYSISGWFTEPTDILVSIMDKESREIVETITVRVTYLEDRQEYELTITNLNTLYANQKQAVEANESLMQYFYDQGYVTDYPDYFGGCYIESDKLHIRLVNPSDEDVTALSRVLDRYAEVVVYENGEMSMADLQAYADETADELIKLGYQVTSWYVDSITGNVVIQVLEEDLSAVTAWVAGMVENSSAPQIIVEKGNYISLD